MSACTWRNQKANFLSLTTARTAAAAAARTTTATTSARAESADDADDDYNTDADSHWTSPAGFGDQMRNCCQDAVENCSTHDLPPLLGVRILHPNELG